MCRNWSNLIVLGAIPFCLPSNVAYANERAYSCEQAKAEAFAPDNIDVYVQRRMQRDHIPGVSVAILRAGKVILCKGYGMANVELSSAATENLVYQIASLTKPFTATAIMLLVEDGKLGLDVHVTKYLPDLPTTWEKVTVRSNYGNVESFSRGIAARIIPALGSGVEQPIAETDAATTVRLKAMIQKLATGEVDPANFTEESKENAIPLLKSLKDWFASMGALKSFQPHERSESDQRREASVSNRV